MNRKLAEKVAQAGVLTDVIGDTLEASGTAAAKSKVTVAPRKIARAKTSRRSLQKV